MGSSRGTSMNQMFSRAFVIFMFLGGSILALPWAEAEKTHYINTSYGLEITFTSEYSSNLLVQRIDTPFNWTDPEDDITLDVFFNVSSRVLNETDMSMTYSFDHVFGERPADFDPDTLTFSEVVGSVITPLPASRVNVDTGIVSVNLEDVNVSYNRTYTISGELDLEPPESVDVTSIETGENDVVEIVFEPVADAFGYYLYLSEKKCVYVAETTPHENTIYSNSPILLTHLNSGDIVYIAIAAVDIAGNFDPNVNCRRYVIKMPNTAPVANIDTLSGSYSTGEEVYFTCRGTFDPNPGDDLTYSWDLDGDGDEDSNLETPVHRYDRAATYRVVLVVTDEEGLTDTDEMTVVIEKDERGDLTIGERGVPLLFVVIAIGLFLTTAIIVHRYKKTGKKKSKKSGKRKGTAKKLNKREGRTGRREKVTFRKKPDAPTRLQNMESEIFWGPHSYRERLEQWVNEVVPEKLPIKEAVMEGISEVREGIYEVREGISEVRKALPVRGTRPARRSEGSGSIPSGRGPGSVGRKESKLVAAISLDDEEGLEKRREYFACSRCDEVLEVVITILEDGTEGSYPMSCPACGVKGRIMVDRSNL